MRIINIKLKMLLKAVENNLACKIFMAGNVKFARVAALQILNAKFS